MGRFLVMDVVFYGGSLNYDQGSGNYQELKKITRWDGRQYTLVSRYALRYSILNDTGIFGHDELAPGSIFTKDTSEKGKGDVFNPRPEVLFNGEILKYPEFDLFGYLITKSEPTQSRTAPVRISHAISMTPFYYDAHFSGNHWIAQRALKAGLTTKLEPNLFTAEEHHTYYLYTVVVDVDQVGRFSVFTTKKDDVESLKQHMTIENEKNEFIKGKMSLILPNGNTIDVDVAIIPIYKPEEEKSKGKKGKSEQREPVLYEIQYDLGENIRKERVLKLVEAVLELKRNIKGRSENLKPKLLVLGIYKDKPYDTFKDRIQLIGEFTEEEYVEIEERDGKTIRRIRRILTGENGTEEYIEEIVESKSENSDEKRVQVKRKRSMSKKKTAVFEISRIHESAREVKSKQELICYIEKMLFGSDKECNTEGEDKKTPEVFIFKDPSIEVRLK